MPHENSATANKRALVCVAILCCLLAAGCQERGNTNEPRVPTPTPTPSPAKVTLVAPAVTSEELDCGENVAIWSGPPSNIFVKLKGTEGCPASLMFEDRRTRQQTPAGQKSVNPAGDPPVMVTVDPNFRLVCDCGGQGNNKCSCEVTRVDPQLPGGMTLGPPTTIPAGGTVANPAAPPATGTKVKLSCGKKDVVLWTGNQSYITVSFIGTDTCTASVTGRLGDQGGSEELTTEIRYCRTFGPVNKITASCIGRADEDCEFQITEVVDLLKP